MCAAFVIVLICLGMCLGILTAMIIDARVEA